MSSCSRYPATVSGLFTENGPVELVWRLMDVANERMSEQLSQANLENMPVNDRIALGVRYRLQQFLPYQSTWAQAMALGCAPTAFQGTFERLLIAADEIWYLAGDASTSTSWYSRRLMLSTVMASTEVYMITDTSPGHRDTWEFLDRRLKDAAKFGWATDQRMQAVNQGLDALGALGQTIMNVFRPFMFNQEGQSRIVRPQPYPFSQYDPVPEQDGGSMHMGSSTAHGSSYSGGPEQPSFFGQTPSHQDQHQLGRHRPSHSGFEQYRMHSSPVGQTSSALQQTLGSLVNQVSSATNVLSSVAQAALPILSAVSSTLTSQRSPLSLLPSPPSLFAPLAPQQSHTQQSHTQQSHSQPSSSYASHPSSTNYPSANQTDISSLYANERYDTSSSSQSRRSQGSNANPLQSLSPFSIVGTVFSRNAPLSPLSVLNTGAQVLGGVLQSLSEATTATQPRQSKSPTAASFTPQNVQHSRSTYGASQNRNPQHKEGAFSAGDLSQQPQSEGANDSSLFHSSGFIPHTRRSQ